MAGKDAILLPMILRARSVTFLPQTAAVRAPFPVRALARASEWTWPWASALACALAAACVPAGTVRADVAGYVGLGVLSGGDDRPKPAALVGGTFGAGWYASLFLYGERFTIVSRNAQILGGGRQWTLPYSFSKRFSLAGGASLLREETRIAASGASAAEAHSSWNLGANLAFKFRAFDFTLGAATCSFDVDWNVHVFPAGFATLYLATGRRQIVSIVGGVAFP